MPLAQNVTKLIGWTLAGTAIGLMGTAGVGQSIPPGGRWTVPFGQGSTTVGGYARNFCSQVHPVGPTTSHMTVQRTASVSPVLDVYSITAPDVRHPVINIGSSDIPLRKGDTVRVYACGCVQTGSVGKTWKSYVYPQGDNASKRYWGTFNLLAPGYQLSSAFQQHPTGMFKIRDIINDPSGFAVTANNMTVLLGYVDDNYSDNGYWGHDDGTNNQCKGVGPAAVDVAVFHHA